MPRQYKGGLSNKFIDALGDAIANRTEEKINESLKKAIDKIPDENVKKQLSQNLSNQLGNAKIKTEIEIEPEIKDTKDVEKKTKAYIKGAVEGAAEGAKIKIDTSNVKKDADKVADAVINAQEKIQQKIEETNQVIKNQQSSLKNLYLDLFKEKQKLNDISQKYDTTDVYYLGSPNPSMETLEKDGFVNLIKQYYDKDKAESLLSSLEHDAKHFARIEEEYYNELNQQHFLDNFKSKSFEEQLELFDKIAKKTKRVSKDTREAYELIKDMMYTEGGIYFMLDDGKKVNSSSIMDLGDTFGLYGDIRNKIQSIEVMDTWVDSKRESLDYQIQNFNEEILKALDPLVENVQKKLTEAFKLDDHMLSTYAKALEEYDRWEPFNGAYADTVITNRESIRHGLNEAFYSKLKDTQAPSELIETYNKLCETIENEDVFPTLEQAIEQVNAKAKELDVTFDEATNTWVQNNRSQNEAQQESHETSDAVQEEAEKHKANADAIREENKARKEAEELEDHGYLRRESGDKDDALTRRYTEKINDFITKSVSQYYDKEGNLQQAVSYLWDYDKALSSITTLDEKIIKQINDIRGATEAEAAPMLTNLHILEAQRKETEDWIKQMVDSPTSNANESQLAEIEKVRAANREQLQAQLRIKDAKAETARMAKEEAKAEKEAALENEKREKAQRQANELMLKQLTDSEKLYAFDKAMEYSESKAQEEAKYQQKLNEEKAYGLSQQQEIVAQEKEVAEWVEEACRNQKESNDLMIKQLDEAEQLYALEKAMEYSESKTQEETEYQQKLNEYRAYGLSQIQEIIAQEKERAEWVEEICKRQEESNALMMKQLDEAAQLADYEKAMEYANTLAEEEAEYLRKRSEYAEYGKQQEAEYIAKAKELNQVFEERDRKRAKEYEDIFYTADGKLRKAGNAPNIEALNNSNALYDELETKVKRVYDLKEATLKLDKDTLVGQDGIVKNDKEIEELTERIVFIIKEINAAEAIQEDREQRLLDIDNERDGVLKDILHHQELQSRDQMQSQVNKWISDVEELQNSVKYTKEFQDQLDKVYNSLLNFDSAKGSIDEVNASFEKLSDTMKGVNSDKALSDFKKANSASIAKLNLQIEEFLRKNTRMGRDFEEKFNSLKLEWDTSTSTKRIQELVAEFAKLKAEVTAADKLGAGFFDTLRQRAMGVNAQLIAQYLSWQDIIRYIRTAVDTVKDLDSALTEMRKVSDESLDSLKKYQQVSFNMAGDIGATAIEVQNTTADWMRLGESLDDAAESAKAATILLNVSEFENIDEATQALVSVSQAYKEIDKMDIIDVINNVGNNYAVATNELAQGLQDAAAVLKTQGNDLYEATALLTAGNAVTQDISKVAGGIRTISLRIAGTEEAKEELKEIGEETDDMIVGTSAKLQQIIKDYTAVASNAYKGVDILDANGNLRNTYNILLDISKIYQEIIEEDKKAGTNRAQALVETIAGKNRSNIAASILLNPQLLEDVYNTARKSAGSAQEELDKYLESIEGHLKEFQNAVQELVFYLIDSGVINDVLDFGTEFVEILTEIVKQLNKLPGPLGTISTIATGVGIRQLILNLDKIPGLLLTIDSAASNYLGEADIFIGETAGAINQIGTASITSSKYVRVLGKVLMGLAKNPLAKLLLVAGGAYLAFDLLTTSVKEADEKVKETESDIESLKAEIKQLQGIEDPTGSQKEYLKRLERELELKEKILELDKQSKAEQRFKYGMGEVLDFDNEYNKYLRSRTGREIQDYNTGKVVGYYANPEASLKLMDVEQKAKEYLQVLATIDTSTEDGIKKYDEYSKKMTALAESSTDARKTLYTEIYDLQTVIDGIDSDIENGYLQKGTQAYENALKIKEAYEGYIKADQLVLSRIEALLLRDKQPPSSDTIVSGVVGDINNAYEKVMDEINEARPKKGTVQNYFSDFSGTEIGERIKHLNDLFTEGEITYRQYMEGLQTEFDNFDASSFTNTLEDAKKAEIQFFADSAQVVSQGLSDLYSNWNAGNIDVNEYLDSYLSMGSMLSNLTDRLQENSAAWNENGEAISDSENKALDETQELLSSSMAVIENFQDSIYSLTQINSGAIKAGTDEYRAHLEIIAEDVKAIIDAGGEDADILASRLGTTTAEIAQSMYDNVANLGIAEQGIMNNTNNAITNMATAIGDLFDTLGEEISNFKVDLKFSPKFDGSKTFTILGKEFTVPQIKFELAASGKSLTNIGNAIKSFGTSIKDNIGSQLLTLEDFHISEPKNTDTASKRYGSYVPKNAADSYDKTLEKVKEASKAASGSAKEAEDSFEELYDYFERMIKVLDNSIDLLEAHLEDVVGSFAKNSLLDAEEDLIQSKMNGYSSAIEMYSQKASEALSKIPSDIAEKIQSGAVDIDEFIGESNKDVVEAIQEYEKWADKVQDCKLQIVQLKEAIRKLELDKFNNVMKDFTDQFDLRQSAGIDLISKQIDLLKEAGELIGESFYKRQQEQAEKQLDILTRAQEALVKQLNEALSRGVDVGSEEWLSMVDSLTETEGKIIDCKKAIEEFDNAILELHTEIFNRIQDQFSAFASELSNMQQLINDDANPVATVKNQWTDEGLAQLGLLAQQYELAKYQVAQYNEEIERLNQLYLQGKYSTTEYADKLIELKNAQWSAVEASESALDSIRSLNQERVNIVVEGINEEIESYEKYTQAIKDNLSAEKDLHDYQKQIADENKSILDIQRQLAAIQDDDSQAARARRAKLEEQLKEAQDTLAETEYSHSIESQQDALDKQLEQYKETRQAEIDALQESLLNVEKILADTFEAVRNNSQLIGETILAQAQAHGVEMSQVLTNAWFQGENAIAHYGEILTSASSNFIGQIQGVEYQVYELQNQANATAEGLAYMFSTRADNLVDELTRSYTSEYNLEQMTNALHNALSNTIDGSYSGASAAAALNSIADAANGVADAANSAASALRSMMSAQSESAASNAAGQLGLGAAGNLIGTKTRVTSIYGGPNAGKVAVWTKKGGSYKFRAKGSKSIPSDELAWTQENGPEMIISPSDGAILTPLKRGDAVLPTEQTSNIWEWSRFNPEEFASKLIQSIDNVEGGKVQTNTMQVGSLVTVNGNVNDSLEMMQIASTTASAKIKQSFKELSNGLNG